MKDPSTEEWIKMWNICVMKLLPLLFSLENAFFTAGPPGKSMMKPFSYKKNKIKIMPFAAT